MSVTQTDPSANLRALIEQGTSPWLDLLRRSLVTGGELERLISERSLRGVTSNPSIFKKAILESQDYDSELAELFGLGLAAQTIYEQLAITDVQMACDVMRGVWESCDHQDGFISLEIAAALAHDEAGAVQAARDFWERVDRPNLMVKIPGTLEGLGAIEQSIYEGINVNITLLFGVEMYERVAEAYLRGLERRREEGESLDVASVASFFVSRVDTAVDRRLTEAGDAALLGTAAVANARLAYRSFERIFSQPRWQALERAGAWVQRPLWASTGVKNPSYRDTIYVEQLIGEHTVSTMPPQTLEAVVDHGRIAPGTVRDDPDVALARLREAGIDLKDVTDELLTAGVAQFEQATVDLLEGIEARRHEYASRTGYTEGAG